VLRGASSISIAPAKVEVRLNNNHLAANALGLTTRALGRCNHAYTFVSDHLSKGASLIWVKKNDELVLPL